MKQLTGIAVALTAGLSAVPADAEEYRIRVTATVPAECELSIVNRFQDLGSGRYRIARLDQFCNTGYQMTVSHAGLSAPAFASFRNSGATLQQGSGVLVADGGPVNGAADLFLDAATAADAEIFSQTLFLSVAGTGI